MLRAILFASVLGAATSALAQQDPRLERCTTLSFAPLEVNVPACTALLDDAARFDQSTLGAIYAARAEAYEFGIAYHGEIEVQPDELLALALADLDQAVQLSARYHLQRGDVLFRLSRFVEAADNFTAAIAATSTPAPDLFQRRSMAWASAGEHENALNDIDAAILGATSPLERARLLLQRAELRETVGDADAAIADYQAVLQIDSSQRTAIDALRRLQRH
jgi:tetratricopeptide (TPR) repeat protein